MCAKHAKCLTAWQQNLTEDIVCTVNNKYHKTGDYYPAAH